MILAFSAEKDRKLPDSVYQDFLKEKYVKLSNIKPKGKKEFCAFVLEKNRTKSPTTAIDVISTRFFQNMQKSEPSAQYHEKILAFIVPNIMKAVQEYIPQANNESAEAQQVNEWVARLLESYLTEEQIKKHCALQDSVSEEVMEERKSIGKELYKLATNNQLTENDLDALIVVSRFALERLQNADHVSSTLNITGRYLNLFSINKENPTRLGEDILRLLSTSFREKMFSQKE